MTTDEQWAEYTRTIVEIAVTDEISLEIQPAKEGEVDEWPSWLTPPVHLVTAWDPADERPGETNNRIRQDSLVRELRHLGASVRPAVGREPMSDHREEGLAVLGLSEGVVLDIARRYGQSAIFVWTPEAWSTVSCVDGSRRAFGWRVVNPAR